MKSKLCQFCREYSVELVVAKATTDLSLLHVCRHCLPEVLEIQGAYVSYESNPCDVLDAFDRFFSDARAGLLHVDMPVRVWDINEGKFHYGRVSRWAGSWSFTVR